MRQSRLLQNWLAECPVWDVDLGLSRLTMPPFFLPLCPSESQEASYAHLAKGCGRKVPPIGQRIYSISFEDHGIVWTATVGEYLRGRKALKLKNKETVEWQIEDPALIVAIFPKVPCCVVTYSKAKSRFGQTFYVIPKGVELFTT
jgi:hypothetical protein